MARIFSSSFESDSFTCASYTIVLPANWWMLIEYPSVMLEVGGKKGIIRYIGSGRVQIDYNHQFAGKTIVYEAHVKESLSKDEEKIRAIVGHHLGTKSTLSLEGTKATVQIDEQLFRADVLQGIKHLTQIDIFKFAPTLKSVNFVETHVNKKLAPKEEPKKELEKEPKKV